LWRINEVLYARSESYGLGMLYERRLSVTIDTGTKGGSVEVEKPSMVTGDRSNLT